MPPKVKIDYFNALVGEPGLASQGRIGLGSGRIDRPLPGNIVELGAPDPADLFGPGISGRAPVGAPVRAFTLGPENAQQRGAASWIIDLSVELANPPGTLDTIMPNLVARITFGPEGGAANVVEVDAWNATVQIPGEVVTVDLFFERMGPAPAIPSVHVSDAIVIATAHRSSAPIQTSPIRSFWVLAGPDPAPVFLDIPKFARAWNYLPQFFTAVGVSPLTAAGPMGGRTDFVLPAVLESMSRMNQFRVLPPASQRLMLTPDYTAGDATFPGMAQFQIQL